MRFFVISRYLFTDFCAPRRDAYRGIGFDQDPSRELSRDFYKQSAQKISVSAVLYKCLDIITVVIR